MKNKTAMLVIDMQEDLFKKDRLIQRRADLVKNINDLAEYSRANNIPIIWVYVEYENDLSDAPKTFQKKNIRICIKDTPGADILSELHKQRDEKEFIKKNYSAFFGTNLHEYLQSIGADTLIMSGINTHACIRTSAIDAFQLGYDVILPKECVDSYDEDHHTISLTYMANRIATVIDLGDITSYI